MAKFRFQQKHIWTPLRDALLGTDSDRAIGLQLGIPTPTVWRRRTALQIPGAFAWRNERRPSVALKGGLYYALVLLGYTVRRIAHERGVTTTTIHKSIRLYRARMEQEHEKTKATGSDVHHAPR